MGLLPLRMPPKPQPYENTKRFVRRCRSLFSSVLLSGAQGGSLSASHTNHPFCAARCLPGRRRSGRANDFYSFSSGQTACRKSCAFAPGCRRTGLSARSPHTAALGGRFALHASALALRGIAGLFQMKKGRLRAKSCASSAVAFRHAPAGAAAAPFSNFSLWRVCLYGPPFLFSCGLHICKNFFVWMVFCHKSCGCRVYRTLQWFKNAMLKEDAPCNKSSAKQAVSNLSAARSTAPPHSIPSPPTSSCIMLCKVHV